MKFNLIQDIRIAVLSVLLILIMANASMSTPRFSKIIHDAGGKQYTITIQAEDEKIDVISANQTYCAYAEGNRRAYGHYYAFVAKKNSGKLIKQDINLFSEKNTQGEFNLELDMVQIFRSRSKGQPDVLVVRQYGASNYDTVKAFIISNGKLKLLTFKRKSGGSMQFINDSRDQYAFVVIGPYKFKSAVYNNIPSKYEHSVWKLDLSKLRMIEIKSYSNDGS